MINKRYTKGFTLMETLVAITVLTVALAGPLTIAHKGLQTALIAKNQTTAFFLAQDAIEFIRYARDSNCLAAGIIAGCPSNMWLQGSVINLGVYISPTGSATSTIDTITPTVPAAVCSGACTPLNYSSTTNLYSHKTGTSDLSASIFTRSVSIQTPVCNAAGSLCNADEALVTVVVTWRDPIPHTVTVRESLFNWQ